MNQNGVDIETEGFTAAGLASLPLSDNFSVYAKAGVFFWDRYVNSVSDGGDRILSVPVTFPFSPTPLLTSRQPTRYTADSLNLSS